MSGFTMLVNIAVDVIILSLEPGTDDKGDSFHILEYLFISHYIVSL